MRRQVKADGRVASGKLAVPGQPVFLGLGSRGTCWAGLGTGVRIQERRHRVPGTCEGFGEAPAAILSHCSELRPGCESRGGSSRVTPSLRAGLQCLGAGQAGAGRNE